MDYLTSPPEDDAVSLETLKRFLYYGEDDDSQDETLTEILATATEDVESMVSFDFAEREWEYHTSAFCRRMKLPHRPVKSVEFVKYLDSEGELQTVNPDDYTVLNPHKEWTIIVFDSYPSVPIKENAVQIGYTTGFEVTPASAKSLICYCAGVLDKQRGTPLDGQKPYDPTIIERLATNLGGLHYR